MLPFLSAQKLIEHKPSLKKPKENHRRKIAIVESYISTGSIRAVARTLRIRRESIKEAVEEWKQDGYITVDSSMNYEPKSNYGGVRKRGNKWVYETKINGSKVYKGGFETELEAFEALTKLRIEKK